MKFDFIEIGTCNFEALIEKATDETQGLSIEPIKSYLDSLPNKKNVIKVQAAVTEKDGVAQMYYVKEETMKQCGLSDWISGSNSIGKPHKGVIERIGQKFYDEVVTIEEVPTISWQTLITTYEVEQINYLKIDAEGYDHIILSDYLDLCEKNSKLFARAIKCEYDTLISNIGELDKVLLRLEKYYDIQKGRNDATMTIKQTVFYQSSMPRAGSTLLQNLMGQNPEFHVTPTSGMIDLMLGTRIGYNGNKEAQAGHKEMWKKGFYAFCREGFKGYVANLTDKPYVLDKNRNWAASYPLLANIYPDPKILFLVRDLRAVFASMEKKFRANPDIEDGTVDNMNLTGLTTQQRVEKWAVGHPIGHALPKLYQSILDKSANKFLFLRYEDLCTAPESTMQDIYKYLEVPYFKHDFKTIPQITVEDDTVHGIYGDHTIRNTLGMLPDDSKEILGDYTCEWIYENFRWYFDTFNYKK